MKPTLKTELIQVRMGQTGTASSVPDLTGDLILQNNLTFCLEEDDEIYEGYGRRKNGFPYRQQNTYTRELSLQSLEAQVLENDYLRAVFLPMFGGRLWELKDKTTGRNLLYTNDVIRYSNLSVRNAWFSGGVEWNVGIIGHSPFTNEQLFTARLENDKSEPILRMYEYERVRGAEYQMDFWLGENDTCLNCRMRIVNTSDQLIPMYWWSNMAVPEYEGGRIAVPAKEAFTSKDGLVYKTDIPMVDEVDITNYCDIPDQVDYFFHIPKEAPKYIANFNKNGEGFLHVSTNRLQSRKLFSWGHNEGSDRWQEFLTEDAGRYVEIQAGLGKTQYGCIPMAPHTVWEWAERYTSLDIEGGWMQRPYEEFEHLVTEKVLNTKAMDGIDKVLKDTKHTAKTKGELIKTGSGYGALQNLCREQQGQKALSEHLDYGRCPDGLARYIEFLKTGILFEPGVGEEPDTYLCEQIFCDKLVKTIGQENQNNWYAHYHLALYYMQDEVWGHAGHHLEKSLYLKESPWAYHAMAVLRYQTGENTASCEMILKGYDMRRHDLSYLKETLKILRITGNFGSIADIYEELSGMYKDESRIRYEYINALYYLDKAEQAYGLLNEGEGLVLEDIREGEDSVGQLYQALHLKLFGDKGTIPHIYHFEAIIHE